MQITLRELQLRIEAAEQRMSRKNPHRELFHQCSQVLVQMATHIQILETALTASHLPCVVPEPSVSDTHAEGASPAV